MKYVKLGKSDVQVSEIVHGCLELGGGPWEPVADDYNMELLAMALQNGVTTFDTAEMYGDGHSEEVVGKALAGKRDQCVIATKVLKKNLMPDDVRKAAEASLRRLNTSYVDLYYIHWPNDDIPIGKTIGEFNKLKEEGLIKAIGVSNFSVAQLKDAMNYGVIDAIQVEYNLFYRDIENELLPFCQENSISVLSYNSIAKGILSGAFHLYGAFLNPVDFRNAKPLFQTDSLIKERPLILLLEEIAKKKNTTISQIAIRWLLYQPGMASTIVGTQNKKHFMDNFQAGKIVLSEAEREEISILSHKVIQSL
jgi:myo-inositol catabolism protein IolS